ncbi:hypothetical protein E2C01_064154 [Portunus trituberculatus]|uniref:Uncharacterized protein n=1 Tax=Portunus trituberculatus TaxID=210409 RepID=A0A5B7HAY8_PORTR|nr:hypothetical protein [Portunus trituberculatus]
MRGGVALVIVRAASYRDANDVHDIRQRRSRRRDAGDGVVLLVEVNTVSVLVLLGITEAPQRISD